MQNIEDAHAVLARELNSLSLQERNRVFESIHGVDDVMKETPEMVEEKLAEFQHAVESLETTEASLVTAYIQAKRDNPAYVANRAFRLMFLRAEGFDPQAAAVRMMQYLEEKLSRFGPKVLTRTLTMADLSTESRALLVDFGIHQILPARDSAGRAIYLIHADDAPRHVVRENPMAATDLVFYMMSAAAEDEETQKRGMITLQVVAVLPRLEDLEVIRHNVKRSDTSKWCPLRVKANHIWVKNSTPLIRTTVDILTKSLSKGNRMRTRIHTGSYTELGYQLMTYGFPADCLPYATDGEELRVNAHARWLNRRKKKETVLRTSTEFKALDLPGCRDVCLGRGSASHQHAGNVYMRALMSTLIEEYRGANAPKRQELNKRLVQMVREGGGRFLTRTTAGWYEEVTDEADIVRKVGGSFRGMLSRTSTEYGGSNNDHMEEDRSVVTVKRPRLETPSSSVLSSSATNHTTSCWNGFGGGGGGHHQTSSLNVSM